MGRQLGVLRQLDAEWVRIGSSPEARRAMRCWSIREPALGGFWDWADVVEHVNERGCVEADALLLALLRLAPDDDRAARVVLQAMMPAVKRQTRDFAAVRVWCPEETALTVLAAMWERIRSYPVERRCRKVSANLALDTRQRVWRTGYKQVHGRLPRPGRAVA